VIRALRLVALAALLASGASVLACIVRPRPDWGTDDDSFGTVAAELSTVGPDGATYLLPSTARITLTGKESGDAGQLAWTGTFAQNEPTETFSVPAGVYAATLSNAGSDAGSTWSLIRQADGGATSIIAVLTDAMPISVTVASGQTTKLVFHFATEQLGDVTFGTGGVGVGVALDAGAFGLSTAKITGTASMSVDSVDGTNKFDKAFDFNGTVSVPYTMSLMRSGGWTIASDRACAPVSGTASSTSKNAALAAVFAEASGGTGTICFGDPNLSGAFSVQLARKGAPTTSTLKTDLPDGGVFEVQVAGLAPEVFDGTTLHLATLKEPFTATNAAVSELVTSGTTVVADITGDPTGTATITLKP
jgi:hypothetical protein